MSIAAKDVVPFTQARVLYALTGSTVHLLSIRHHRQLLFAFAKLWE